MQLGHLQLHRQDVKMRRQEVHAIPCLMAAHLQVHRLLPQELTSYDKVQWVSQVSVVSALLNPETPRNIIPALET